MLLLILLNLTNCILHLYTVELLVYLLIPILRHSLLLVYPDFFSRSSNEIIFPYFMWTAPTTVHIGTSPHTSFRPLSRILLIYLLTTIICSLHLIFVWYFSSITELATTKSGVQSYFRLYDVAICYYYWQR